MSLLDEIRNAQNNIAQKKKHLEDAKNTLKHVLSPLLNLFKIPVGSFDYSYLSDEKEVLCINYYSGGGEDDEVTIPYSMILSNDLKREKERLDLIERQQEISEEIEETETRLKRLNDARRLVEERINNENSLTG